MCALHIPGIKKVLNRYFSSAKEGGRTEEKNEGQTMSPAAPPFEDLLLAPLRGKQFEPPQKSPTLESLTGPEQEAAPVPLGGTGIAASVILAAAA